MTPVQESYGLVPGYAIFWAMFLLAFCLFLFGIVRLIRYLDLGTGLDRVNRLGWRVAMAFSDVLLQRCNLRRVSRKDLAGLGHAVLFWGFCLFLLGYVVEIIIVGGLGAGTVEGTRFVRYLGSALDVAGICILAAVGWAAARRFILRPERLERNREAALILVLIALLMIGQFALEGLRFSLGQGPGTWWSPGGRVVAHLVAWSRMAIPQQENLYHVSWWVHYALLLIFLVYIPRSKHLHILASPVGLILRPEKRVGSFEAPRTDLSRVPPALDLRLLGKKHLLDLYSCTECGRCQAACPATRSGTALKPKDMVVRLKHHLVHNGEKLLRLRDSSATTVPAILGTVVKESEIWACTTCGACQEECPVMVEHVNRIVNLRRSAIESGMVSPSVANCLEGLQLVGNPWRQPPGERIAWARGLSQKRSQDRPVEILYWVGCSGAYDPKGQEISRAMARILDSLDIRYEMLGTKERCCGEPARRIGDEGLFEKLAMGNIAILKAREANKIVTHCPHCYNTLRNEYRALGADFEVLHHTQFLAELTRGGLVKPRMVERKVTFHDPCYLGRYNGRYDDVRDILAAMPGINLAEMAENRDRAMCCGGGGGHMWIEGSGDQRIDLMRFGQAERTGAEMLLTACPFCRIMLDDAANYLGPASPIKVRDISELVWESMSGTPQ